MDKLRIPYSVIEIPEEEDHEVMEDPEDYVRKVALRKAMKAAKRVSKGVVIAADTVILCEGEIFGKPKNAEEAKLTLRLLSGKIHEALTGLAVVDAESSKKTVSCVRTKVKMRRLTEEEISGYLSTGEPFGKAGSYAIQGLGAILIERVEGCFYNVVGLPLAKLAEILKNFGIEILKSTD